MENDIEKAIRKLGKVTGDVPMRTETLKKIKSGISAALKGAESFLAREEEFAKTVEKFNEELHALWESKLTNINGYCPNRKCGAVTEQECKRSKCCKWIHGLIISFEPLKLLQVKVPTLEEAIQSLEKIMPDEEAFLKSESVHQAVKKLGEQLFIKCSNYGNCKQGCDSLAVCNERAGKEEDKVHKWKRKKTKIASKTNQYKDSIAKKIHKQFEKNSKCKLDSKIKPFSEIKASLQKLCKHLNNLCKQDKFKKTQSKKPISVSGNLRGM